jgi:hypothetical protein
LVEALSQRWHLIDALDAALAVPAIGMRVGVAGERTTACNT